MHKDIESILLTENRLAEITSGIADEINRDYKGKNPLLIGLLKGSCIFLADLARKIKLDCYVDFLTASSYGNGTESSGSVKVGSKGSGSFKGADIILVEDILDSGRTLSCVREHLRGAAARSVKICTLLDKPARRAVDIYPDYFGVQIPDLFVVGYGMDYAEKYRNLPYIGTLKPEIFS